MFLDLALSYILASDLPHPDCEGNMDRELGCIIIKSQAPLEMAQARTAITTRQIVPSDPTKPIIPQGAVVSITGSTNVVGPSGHPVLVYQGTYQGHFYTFNPSELQF